MISRLLLAACVVVSLASPSVAGPPQDNKALAAAHYKLGATLFDQGSYDEAFNEFEQAYQLAPRPLVVYHMARARQRAGKLADALALYNRYLTQEPTGKASDDAKTQIDAIQKELEAQRAAAKPPAVPVTTNTTAPPATTTTTKQTTTTPSTTTPPKADTSSAKSVVTASVTTSPTPSTSTSSESRDTASPLRPDHAAASIEAGHDAAPLTGLGQVTEAPTAHPRRWGWVGAAAAAVVVGVLLDTLPGSAKNGKVDALDFAPVACYAGGAGAAIYGLGWL